MTGSIGSLNRKAAALDARCSVESDHAPVVGGRVADMALKTVLRFLAAVAAHPAVARLFGKNRRCLDLRYRSVTTDDCAAGEGKLGGELAVHLNLNCSNHPLSRPARKSGLKVITQRAEGALHREQ